MRKTGWSTVQWDGEGRGQIIDCEWSLSTGIHTQHTIVQKQQKADLPHSTGVDGELLDHCSGVQVVDQQRSIGRPHGNQRGIEQPVLGGKGWAHTHTGGGRGKPHPQVPQQHLYGQHTIFRGAPCSKGTDSPYSITSSLAASHQQEAQTSEGRWYQPN